MTTSQSFLFFYKEMMGDFKQVLLYVGWALLKSTEVSSLEKKQHIDWKEVYGVTWIGAEGRLLVT